MENASKALLIAAGMLLVVLVLTFMIMVFTRMASQTSDIYANLEQSDIDEFNQKFFKYEYKKELTIQDVVSIINLAKESNEKGKMPVKVEVIINATISGYNQGMDLTNTANLNKLLKDNMDINNNKYKCTVSYAENSELVGKIVIEND